MIFVVDVPEKLYNKYCVFVQKMYNESQDKEPVTDEIVLKYILTNNKAKEVMIHCESNEIKKVMIEYDKML